MRTAISIRDKNIFFVGRLYRCGRSESPTSFAVTVYKLLATDKQLLGTYHVYCSIRNWYLTTSRDIEVIWNLIHINMFTSTLTFKRETGNLVLRHSVVIKILPMSPFHRILEVLCIEWRNSTPHSCKNAKRHLRLLN